jgi:quinol-cytochrome oxidoreductase complex cytochrome b subunit
MDKIFPDHWSFMLGELAMYSFVVLLVTGVFLSLYYVPSIPSSSPALSHSGRSIHRPSGR